MYKIKKISDLKKGDKVILNYGDQNGNLASCGTFTRMVQLMLTSPSFHPWEAVLASNPRGKNPTIVFLEVHGFETELGDTYAHKIIGWWDGSLWQPIEHTPKQKEAEKLEMEFFA